MDMSFSDLSLIASSEKVSERQKSHTHEALVCNMRARQQDLDLVQLTVKKVKDDIRARGETYTHSFYICNQLPII